MLFLVQKLTEHFGGLQHDVRVVDDGCEEEGVLLQGDRQLGGHPVAGGGGEVQPGGPVARGEEVVGGSVEEERGF